MRGKDAFQRKQLHEVGITPACAGKSLCNLYISVVPKDHPRVCGEKARTLIVQDEPQGSPPRVRGKGNPGYRGRSPCRITPACAGKRCAKRLPPCRYGDHPRVCGEKRTTETPWSSCGGSPPRVRGKEQMELGAGRLWGITPACAGKSFNLYALTTAFWDHPRVCGEKAYDTYHPHMHLGSPPRVRGKAVR